MKRPERDAYVYARVKATMTLRTTGHRRGTSGLRHRRFSLPAVLTGAIALLTMLAGASGAGISSYQGTLYFDGPASSLPASYQLSTTAPPAQGAAPAATQGATGTGGLVTGAYRWIYVTSSGGALTASPTSTQISVTGAGNTPVNVANVPVGGDVYRARIVSGNTGRYTYVGTNAGPTTTYVDTNTSTAGAALPQADTRVPSGSTGYMPFVAGTALGGGDSTVTSTTPPAIPAACAGWTVDSSAGFTFPTGTWTINAQVRPDNPGAAGGAAALTAAVWKVDTSGNTIAGGTIVPPTDSAALSLNNTSQTATVTYTTASLTTLATNERLCVQFWRHQTAVTTSGSVTARTVWLLAYDPNNRISVHPAPTFASAALSSPADGLHTQTSPTLGATYSDLQTLSGTLTIRLCSDAACNSPLQNSGALAANDGETKTWLPTGLSDGTFYWQAQAQDSAGPSSWTSSRSFVIDNVAPATSIDSSPPANSNASSGTIGFSANESVTGFQCHVDGAAWAGCTSPYSYGPLADGSHTFYVTATADLAGNAGMTTSYSWTVDTAPPNTSITTQPSALSNTASPSFSFSSTEAGSTFECNLDGAGFTSCSSPKTSSGVADGPHTFQVRAIDPAGNIDASPSSYGWTIDATPPDTSIGPSKPAALTIATGATFDFSANEAGSTFACSLDGAAFTACSTPKTYSALADGSHTFQVRATDTAANADPTPASYTWTIDTTPPVTSVGPTTPAAHTSSTSAAFDLGSNEAGTFQCSLDGGAYAACTTPKTYSGLADGSHAFAVRATDQAGNVDTSPASYSWSIDNVAPSTPTLLSPSDATLTNAIPQLQASFDDATAGGDTGTVAFQLCSTSAPAGTSCAPLVQSGTSGSVASGGMGSWTASALADGTYYWQARATDAAGNQSGWSATHGFQLDTSAPTVPGGSSPADGAWVSRIELKATFSKPSFAGTGTLEFRICSDGLCLGVVRSGTSDLLNNGAETTWSPSSQPVDGLWYWQVRSHDSAGNTSAWSPTRVLHLDSVAPGKPLHFNGQIAADGLTLRWEAPNDTIANYVVFVNGVPWKNLGSTEFEVKMGPFDANDARTFSVVAVDLAGNVGAMSPALVGVPSLLGLDWAHALSATSSRGLALKRDVAAFPAVPMFVATQDPTAPALVEQGGAVSVSLAAAKGAPLAVRVRPGHVSCKRGCILRLRVELSSSALVRSRLLSGKGRLLRRGVLGTLHAGANTVRVRIPKGLGKGAYRLALDANGESGSAHAFVRVFVA